MASTIQQAAVPVFCASAQMVANAFVHQYYLILHQSPQLVHQFYQDVSKLGRPEVNGMMSITTTMQAINEKIVSLAYGQFMVEITTVDAQESYNGGVLVLVTGYLTTMDYVRRKFTQTFFLAPQERGYFVLNDVLRYFEETKVLNENQGLVNNREAPLAPPQGPSVEEKNHISEQTSSVDEVSHEQVYNPPENGNGSTLEDEVPVPEVVDGSIKNLQVAIEIKSNTEEVPKKSYASIVKFMKETPSSSSNELSPILAKCQEQQVAPSPDPPSDPVVLTSNAVESDTSLESEAYGYSIYIKNLPVNARPPLLENEFKKFGPIKKGGIQVRSQRGFCFGFVEFEMESSMQSAIEASPIMIGGRQAIIEQKKSTNRGSNRGWSSSGMGGGIRNDGVRGRGNNGGGRGYARTDPDSKNEFGNRGLGGMGFTNRRGDGYHRTNKTGGNGSRMHRAGGATVNATAGTTTQRVSVQA